MMLIAFPENINSVTQEFQSETSIKRTLTDAINKYGCKEQWEVSITVLDSVCPLCGARGLITPVMDQCFQQNGHKHKWRNEFINSIYGGGKSFDEAISKAELDAKRFLELLRDTQGDRK